MIHKYPRHAHHCLIMAVLTLAMICGAAHTAFAQSFPPADDLVELDEKMLEGVPEAERELTFNDGLQTLYEQNRDIEVARQNIKDAEILNRQIIAIYFPQVNIQARYQFNDEEILFEQGNVYQPLSPYLDSVYDSDTDLQNRFPYQATPANCASNPQAAGDARCLAIRQPQSGVIQYRHDYSVSATVTQPLFNGQIFAGRKLANLAEQLAQNSVEQAAFQLQQAYIQLYFQAVGLQQQVDISLRNLDNAKLTYEQARILYEEEAGTRFDVTRAQVTLSSAIRQVRNAYTSYQIAIQSLAVLLDVEPNFNVVRPEELPNPESPEQLLQSALEDRPDVESLEMQVRQSELQANRAKARWYPNINAQGNARYGRSSALSGDAISWNIAIIASWDLYDGGARRRDRRTAEVEQVRRELRLAQLRDRIETDIQSAWLEFQNQRSLVETAQAEVELAKENLDLTREANRLGAASALEIERAQNQLFQAEIALNDAEIGLQSIRRNLYRLAANHEVLPMDVH